MGWPFLHICLPWHRNETLVKKFGPLFRDTEEMFIGCPAINDARSGSDVENVDATHGQYISTTAKLDGDYWIVNGHKLWCTNSGGFANLFGVYCTTNPGKPDDEAVAVIYVPADTPGVTQGKPYKKAGMNADLNGDIWFENVRVPAENRAQGPGLEGNLQPGG